jgi:SAM-dependent methyltransferase
MRESMNERALREKQQWNAGTVDQEWAQLRTRFIHVFACPNTQRLNAHWDRCLERALPGKSVLVIGCFRGEEMGHYSARGPARIVGIDISDVAIAHAREHLQGEFHVMDAHAMDFPDQSFDTIIGRGILHHLDFERAVREAARVLKPGGRLLCAEPLGDNPGAKLIRWLNPRSRTADETPLTRQRIGFANQYFGGEHDHWFANLVSVPVAMLTSLLPLPPDNLALRACDRIDAALMRTPFRTWMRYSVLNWQKK